MKFLKNLLNLRFKKQANEQVQEDSIFMSSELVPYFMPSLFFLLVHHEKQKGSDLTQEEVESIRDRAVCIIMKQEDVAKIKEQRGGVDLDPQYCWQEWCDYKSEDRN